MEAIIFLAHHYYVDFDLQKERVFADIHFTLFFVAIINALISCVIYSISSNVATKRWVRLETLDSNHYIAFRQEFHQIEQHLKKLANPKKLKHNSSFYNNNNIQIENQSFSDPSSNSGNFLSFVSSVLKKPAHNLSFGQHGILTGLLEKKHQELLVQLRFHEIRVHFIETHGLKANFK